MVLAATPGPFELRSNVTIHMLSQECLGGMLASSLNASASAAISGGNYVIYVPFVVHRTTTIRKVFWLNGATVAGNVDVGVYDSAGTRLVAAGATAQAGVNAYQEVDVTDTPLTPGQYYLALSISNATATFFANTMVLAQQRLAGIVAELTAPPLPAAATFAAPTGNNVPHFGFTTRASP